MPFGQAPWAGTNALARMFGAAPFWPGQSPPPPAPSPARAAPEPPPPEEDKPTVSDDLQALRAELEELKRSIRGESDAS